MLTRLGSLGPGPIGQCDGLNLTALIQAIRHPKNLAVGEMCMFVSCFVLLNVDNGYDHKRG